MKYIRDNVESIKKDLKLHISKAERWDDPSHDWGDLFSFVSNVTLLKNTRL